MSKKNLVLNKLNKRKEYFSKLNLQESHKGQRINQESHLEILRGKQDFIKFKFKGNLLIFQSIFSYIKNYYDKIQNLKKNAQGNEI